MNSILNERNMQIIFRVKHFLFVGTSCLGIVAVFLFPDVTAAQEASESGILEEIVVTATKRGAQSLQDTAMSIVAVGSETLENTSAEGFDDYIKFVPNLTAVSSGPGQTQIVMRGINSSRISHTEPQAYGTTGLYLEEVPISTTGFNPDLNLFDVNRVEVLRGPQGTLYGASAMAGTVRIITNQPDASTFEGKGETTISTTDGGGENYTIKGLVNIPVVEDRLAVRALAYRSDFDGFIDNIGTGESNYNSDTAVGGRAMASLFLDNIVITGTVVYHDLESDGRPDEILPDPANPFLTGLNDELQVVRYFNDEFNQEFFSANLKLDFDFKWANVVSSTTWSEHDFNNVLDDSFRTRSVAGGLFGGTGPTRFQNIVESENLTQELRIASSGDNRFNWIFGLFYDRQDKSQVEDATAPGLDNILLANDIPPSSGFGAPPDCIFCGFRTIDVRQFALFGEVSYLFFDKLEVLLGGRWFDWSHDFTTFGSGIANDGATFGEVHANEDGFNPKFQLTYNISEDKLVYGTASKGFRYGRSNDPLPASAIFSCQSELISLGYPDGQAPLATDSDSLWSYELGAKTSWLDDRVRINGSFFYIDWSDIQTGTNLDCAFFFFDNAGSVESKGGEIDIQWLARDNLMLFAGGSYTNSELEDNTALGQKGDRAPYVPQYTLSAGAQLDFPVAMLNEGNGFLRFDLRHVSNSYSEWDRPSSVELPSYTVGNLSLGVSFDKYELSLFVKNLWDDRVVTHADPDRRQPAQFSRERPRTIGLTLRVNL